jgi:electron transfer flavoprotein beta subunit
MKLWVVLKMVPDTVEELEVGPDGKSLDPQFLRMILSETDNHALEQALLLKERHGGSVTVVALEAPDLDDVLFTALAKGAEKAVKIPGDSAGQRSPAAAGILGPVLAPGRKAPGPDTLILVGSQAIDDLEGELGPCLAELLGIPYVGVVSAVTLDPAKNAATVVKEFAGGLRGEFDVALPAVLGIQAAEKPPRYVPIAKVRAVMKSAKIESGPAAAAEGPPALVVEKMYKPEAAGQAEMIEGTPEEIVQRLAAILSDRRLI